MKIKFAAEWSACVLLAFGIISAVLLSRIPDVHAAEVTQIYTYEDMCAIADNPYGSYILMQDIDMSGHEWKPIDFYGSFNGGGHALLNVTIRSFGDTTAVTYDGNKKAYDTAVAGLFGVVSGAEISDLRLINCRIEVEADVPCFAGSLAGYCGSTTITNCFIDAYIELKAHDRMFGIGGIAGYGNGHIYDTEVNVTAVCIDTDATTRDEQFMGGAYGAGYMDLDGCTIEIDGYASEHGYAHTGGVAGMYMLYPANNGYEGWLFNTRVTGKITFYEDNTDRRAYCKDFIGEVVDWTYEVGGNSSDFVRDETYDYSVILRPHMCEEEKYTQYVFRPSCTEYGYTLYRCESCGYEYKDNYTPYAHVTDAWNTQVRPTILNKGIAAGECTECGSRTEKYVTVLDIWKPHVCATEQFAN